MEYLIFSGLFVVVHTVCYVLAGVIALKVSEDLYNGEDRLLDFLNDMSDAGQSTRVQKYVFPAQVLRALLMSVVLYPVLPIFGSLSFGAKFAFLFGLMFIFTDIGSAVPFPHNIEGLVYMKKEYLRREKNRKLYFEIAVYSILFGVAGALLF